MRFLVTFLVTSTAIASEIELDQFNEDIYVMNGLDAVTYEFVLANCPSGTTECWNFYRTIIEDTFVTKLEQRWDTLVVFTAFTPSQWSLGGAFAYYSPICNDVEGIGHRVADKPCPKPSGFSFDNSAELFVQGDIKFMLDVVGQEMEHQVGAYVSFERDGECSPDILGRQCAHWSYFVDTDGSVMEGNKWQSLGNNLWTNLRPEGGFFDLDLYLWGFIPPEEVQPFILLENAEIVDAPTSDVCQQFSTCTSDGSIAGCGPGEGVTVRATPRTITIDDIIACEGPRVPAAADAPKTRTQAMILVTTPIQDLKSAEFQQFFDGARRFRREWNAYFYRTTDFTGRVVTTEDNRDDMPWWEFGHEEEGDRWRYSQVKNVTWIRDTDTRQERRVAFDTTSDGGLMRHQNLGLQVGWEHFNFETETVQVDPLWNAILIRMSVDAGSFGRVVLSCGDENDDTELRFPIIPDGVLHQYSLAIPQTVDCVIDTFTLVPSDQAAHVEVDSIEFVLALDDEGQPSTIDTDGDSLLDAYDNCHLVPNTDQADGNRDNFGDACEDADRDGIPNALDNCPLAFNAGRLDTEKPGCADPTTALTTPTCFVQDDQDADGIGDACDPDTATDGCGCSVGQAPGNRSEWLFLIGLVVLVFYRKPAPRSRCFSFDGTTRKPITFSCGK